MRYNIYIGVGGAEGGEGVEHRRRLRDAADEPSLMSPASAAGCVYSWGGGDVARGWRGPSKTGTGPAQRISSGALGKEAIWRVAASRNSIAVGAESQVITWGFNNSRGGGDAWFVRGGHVASIPDSGQLGRWPPASATAIATEAPGAIAVGPLAAEGASSIASGRYHALAIGSSSRTVYSWGLNDHGQLGRSAWASRQQRRRRRAESQQPLRACTRGSRCHDGTALAVERLPAAVAVAAGRYFSVAVGADGRAYAWGRCACGRGAEAVEGSGRGAFGVVAKKRDSGAADEDEEESVRGGNGAGGAGGPSGQAASRIGGARVYALSGGGIESEHVVSAAVGYAHLLLLTSNGAVYSCESGDDGYGGRLQTAPPLNSFGQLGRVGPPLLPQRVPSAQLGVSPPRIIAAGRCASFLTDAAGDVYAWGCAQASGHAKAGAPIADTRSPALLEALRGQRVHALAAGEYHAVAATAAGAVLAWGAGAATYPSGGVATVQGLPSGRAVLGLAAGYQHSLAVVACTSHAEL